MKLFSPKRFIAFHPPLTSNEIPVAQINSQKYLGMQLDKKINFEEHLSKVESKVNKTIGIIRKLQNVLPRSELQLSLTYIMEIYDKAFNKSFHAKLESLQYNTKPAITAAIR